MTDEEDELKREKLKKESERQINRLIWLGVIVLFLIVLIIGFLLHYSPKYK
jgi:capsule polysaccharide export protein KpsE/RkpR